MDVIKTCAKNNIYEFHAHHHQMSDEKSFYIIIFYTLLIEIYAHFGWFVLIIFSDILKKKTSVYL